MDKLLHRIPEVADLTSLSRSTLYEFIRSGRLEAVKIGASVRIPHDAVVALVEELRVSGSNRYPQTVVGTSEMSNDPTRPLCFPDSLDEG